MVILAALSFVMRRSRVQFLSPAPIKTRVVAMVATNPISPG